eukprot:TRINITY_DN9980_c0_g1_i7.p2 TRINITY_DN9980_c0_g1~~TRINITY_DN9980_c0_g1_i7.p2  ORF type:complete len:449 (+),score=144.67 TRINITY_DN9980_c0_g1_i7:76-1422(+)
MQSIQMHPKDRRSALLAGLGAAAVVAAPCFVAPSTQGSAEAYSPSTQQSLRGSPSPAMAVQATSRSPFAAASAAAVVGAAAALASSVRRSERQPRKARAAAVARAAGKLDCVGILGCSGAVGEEMLKCLEERNFPTEKVKLFAKRSAGQVVKSKFGDITIEPYSLEAAHECDIVLMAVSGDFSLEHAKEISGGPKNTQVIDNSSAWRMVEGIPLVIPEINGVTDANCEAPLIANPNCTTAVGAMALWPLHQKYKLKKVIMSTYQAASGAGAEGMAELENGLKEWAQTGSVPKPEFFAHQLPFNVIPQIDKFQENGYTKEEMKVTWELQKIFGLPDDVKVSCTAVRVPTLRAHSESIVIETELPCPPDEAREFLKTCQGVRVVDEPSTLKYPLPLNATGDELVEVGRIRESLIFGDKGLEFFVSGDQLLRGAALNAVIIAEQAAAKKLA